ncbi:Geranylgeranyl pyrophosphate synthase [Escovopsis weberi]|uniref:Prenyltransferase janC n=1 Tax=Escovopsis weberi TaxID=150374 RepID=JANC_ESCWE|nr:Geranylgeranyl pyrophosphate synthase [Escovopsis weberi]DAB41645.1 TPA_exp: prenyl transferase [Escovopsis weberi]
MRMPSKPVDQYGYLKKRASGRAERDGFECPFEYVLNIYGKHHFAPFVKAFQPSLASEDPAKYTLILDIMDAVHFALILVDDISDDSYQRKNHPTAHLIWGASETANRAYLVLTGVINRALHDQPVLGAELMKALEDILQGQDLSLVWRRDGLRSFPVDGEERLAAYKKMAQLKTGTLFTLLGRLLNDGRDDMDDKLLRFGWYAQLQNDCKNIYSSEYAQHKGAVAEDLRNGELSYPIVVALNDKSGRPIMEKALETRAEADIEAAMGALQTQPVRDACLKAMQDAGVGLEKLVALWGRREKMQSS